MAMHYMLATALWAPVLVRFLLPSFTTSDQQFWFPFQSTYVGIFTCELSCGAACSQNAAATGLAFSAFTFRTSLDGLRGESIGDCTCYNSIIADQTTLAAGSGSVDAFFLGRCGPPILGMLAPSYSHTRFKLTSCTQVSVTLFLFLV